ncbi:MAG: hypothetical protein M3Q10_17125 [Chloroflexota bacterium]|nr:hypothetical protein [Chloroflexota bacterium]
MDKRTGAGHQGDAVAGGNFGRRHAGVDGGHATVAEFNRIVDHYSAILPTSHDLHKLL